MSWHPLTWLKTCFNYLLTNFPISAQPKSNLALSAIAIAGLFGLGAVALWKMGGIPQAIVLVVVVMAIAAIVIGSQSVAARGMGDQMHSPEERALARQIDAATKHQYGSSGRPKTRIEDQAAVATQAPEVTMPLPPEPDRVAIGASGQQQTIAQRTEGSDE